MFDYQKFKKWFFKWMMINYILKFWIFVTEHSVYFWFDLIFTSLNCIYNHLYFSICNFIFNFLQFFNRHYFLGRLYITIAFLYIQYITLRVYTVLLTLYLFKLSLFFRLSSYLIFSNLIAYFFQNTVICGSITKGCYM